MHRIAIILLSLWLIITPVYAQQLTPEPPPQGEVATALHESSNLIGQIGVINFIAVLLAVGSVIVTGLFLWFFVRPLLKANTDANKQIAEMASQTTNTQLLVATKLGEIVTNQTNVIEPGIAKIETKIEAVASRNTAVDAVNAHTTAEVQPPAPQV